jgi:hypothetical protein
MGNIDKAKRRIAAAKQSGKTELNLSGLGLTTDELTKMMPAIREIPAIECLDISDNALRSLPDDMLKLPLTELNVAHNKLKRLPDDIVRLPLRELDISDNRLRALPGDIHELNSLNHLYARKNKLTHLPYNIVKLPLTELDVSGNRLTYLHDDMGKLPLVSLDVSENKLTSLPDVSKLTYLGYLHVAANDLERLPKGMNNLKWLIELDVSDNKLRFLPEDLKGLTSLNRLYAERNRLNTLPEDLKKLQSLDVLVLDGNPLYEETKRWLDGSFPDQVFISYNTDANKSHAEVFLSLYPDRKERGEMLARLETCDLELNPVTVGEGANAVWEYPSSVLMRLLSNVPMSGAYEQRLYGLAAKRLLQGVLDPEVPIEDRQDNLAKMAVFQGDCRTPIAAQLMQEWINHRLTQDGSPSEEDWLIIKREAIAAEVSQLATMPSNERIEVREGLLNSIFMRGAEKNPSNRLLKIAGERGRLRSLSPNTIYAFKQISKLPELVMDFTRMVCQTNDKDEPIRINGLYQLDQEKIAAITERYLSERSLLIGGTQDERAKYIKQYPDDIRGIFEASNADHLFTDHLQDPDVNKLLETVPGNELRLRLVKDQRDPQVVYTQYLNEKRSIVEALVQKYPPGLESLGQAAAPLAAAAAATNSERSIAYSSSDRSDSTLTPPHRKTAPEAETANTVPPGLADSSGQVHRGARPKVYNNNPVPAASATAAPMPGIRKMPPPPPVQKKTFKKPADTDHEGAVSAAAAADNKPADSLQALARPAIEPLRGPQQTASGTQEARPNKVKNLTERFEPKPAEPKVAPKTLPKPPKRL